MVRDFPTCQADMFLTGEMHQCTQGGFPLLISYFYNIFTFIQNAEDSVQWVTVQRSC